MMRTRRRSTVLVVTIAALVFPALSPGRATAAAELPRWIAGCWSGTRGAERFTERWAVADNDTLLGVAHTVKDAAVSAFEFLRIVVRGDRLVYIAQPGGAPPTEFAAAPADQSPSAITFANSQHDFPKRVGYRQSGVNALTAWIDGGPTSTSRIEYAMTRVDCEP